MRLPTRSCLVLALLLAGCGDDAGKPTETRAQPQRGFEGKFTAETPNGALTFTLVPKGDVVEIHSNGQRVVGRQVAPDRLEAESREGELTGHMVLTLDGENVRMRVTFKDAEGNAQEVPEMLLRRVGVPAPASGGGGAGGGARDARLVAHWRHTDTRASPQVSYATDTHLVLNDDGTLVTWRKTVSSLSGTDESAHTGGSWKTEKGELWLKDDGDPEWISVGKYGLTDSHLMFTNTRGERTIYERVD
jgi:hypothetical protein